MRQTSSSLKIPNKMFTPIAKLVSNRKVEAAIGVQLGTRACYSYQSLAFLAPFGLSDTATLLQRVVGRLGAESVTKSAQCCASVSKGNSSERQRRMGGETDGVPSPAVLRGHSENRLRGASVISNYFFDSPRSREGPSLEC